jgi:hypothetical protein
LPVTADLAFPVTLPKLFEGCPAPTVRHVSVSDGSALAIRSAHLPRRNARREGSTHRRDVSVTGAWSL